MFRRLMQFFWILFFVAALVGQPFSTRAVSADVDPQGNLFVKRAGPELRLKGKIYRFAGSNNYYLMYKSHFMVDDVLQAAKDSNFRVLRMWGSLEIGNQDGSNSIQGKADGTYFSYWDGTAPAYNDGPDGLQRLDYVLYKAGQLGIRVVIPLVNNWNAFGGMDQYVRWANGQYHDQFYTDPLIRQWYKNWIAHLLNRTNAYTGVQYKDDPTIMTWELANEPRCLSAGAYPRSPNCTVQTLITWANEMSTFIKSIDENHLVSVGDEGFYCIPGATDWTDNCGEGVDTIAFTKLPNIDVMSFHLYPDHWGKSIAWGTQWIKRHFADARKLNKPAMLGEFGLLDKSIRNPVYKEWTDTVFKSGGAGALYWILSGKQDDGTLYADYDGFTVYCPSPVCITLNNFSKMMTANKVLVFPPVADNDTTVTEFETPVTLNPLANDVTYGGAALLPDSMDLDPTSAGKQTSTTTSAGTFAWQPGGTVLFTPAVGYSGKALASYTVKDSAGRVSNAATLTVTVKPSPSGPIMLFSFETGTEGWGPANWMPDAGTVSQTTAFHTDGAYSLQLDVVKEHWFGATFSTPLDLSGRTHLKYDIQTLSSGTSVEVALQLGDGWIWCEGGGWGWVNGNTVTTVDIDLTNLGCANPDFTKVHTIYIYFKSGTFYMDAVRAE